VRACARHVCVCCVCVCVCAFFCLDFPSVWTAFGRVGGSRRGNVKDPLEKMSLSFLESRSSKSSVISFIDALTGLIVPSCAKGSTGSFRVILQ